MPVVTRPSPHLRGKFKESALDAGSRGVKVVSDNPKYEIAEAMLNKVNDPWADYDAQPPKEGRKNTLVATSLGRGNEKDPIISYGNGFVDGINDAFANDLDLVLRPDDVWLAILTQFSLFVVGHAEEVRHLFVQHEGKRRIEVDLTPFKGSQIDLGRVAHEMTAEIQRHVVDPGLKDWMIPKFTTTNELDISVASFVMMGAMQKYFEYFTFFGCGFPSVTLLGEKSDWQDIELRIKKLAHYGPEPEEWSRLLAVVLRYMVRTFDEPDSVEIKDFWLRVSHFQGPTASGTRTLSGWITAFAFWDEDGKRIKGHPRHSFEGRDLEERRALTLDGVDFPLLGHDDVPRSVVALPISLADGDAGVIRRCTAVAGSIGMTLSNSGGKVQPYPAWCVIQAWTDPLTDMFRKTGSTTDGSTSASLTDRDSFDDEALP